MKKLLSLLLFSAGVLSSGAALAAEEITHTASFCRNHGSGGTYSIEYNGNVLNENSRTRLRVICPVTRTTGWNSAKLSVHVMDKSHSDGFSCSAFDKKDYGHSWSWRSWKDTIGGGATNYRTMVFDWNSLYNPYEGTLSLVCYFPTKDRTYGASHIAGYVVNR